MPQIYYLAAEKEKPVRIDSPRLFCVSVCISACVYGGCFMLLTRHMHLLVLLIAIRRLFIVYWSLDRLGERLCGRNGGRIWSLFSRCLQRHQANDTDANDR